MVFVVEIPDIGFDRVSEELEVLKMMLHFPQPTKLKTKKVLIFFLDLSIWSFVATASNFSSWTVPQWVDVSFVFFSG